MSYKKRPYGYDSRGSGGGYGGGRDRGGGGYGGGKRNCLHRTFVCSFRADIPTFNLSKGVVGGDVGMIPHLVRPNVMWLLTTTNSWLMVTLMFLKTGLPCSRSL